MNKILTKKQLSDHAYSFVVENGQIARSSRPGNFVTVRADIHSERIPLVVVDSDKQKGTLTLVVQEAGLSSTKFCQLSEGDEILDVVGPLGTPYTISKVGTVVCVGGGVATMRGRARAEPLSVWQSSIFLVSAWRKRQWRRLAW